MLQAFVVLLNDKQINAKEIVDFLFKIFNFSNDPQSFVFEILGYDRLEGFIKECPQAFKTDLLLKLQDFIDEKSKVYLGFRSHQYLKTELETIAPNLSTKTTDPKKLAFEIKSSLFSFPSINRFDPSEYVSNQPISFGNRITGRNELRLLKLHPSFS